MQHVDLSQYESFNSVKYLRKGFVVLGSAVAAVPRFFVSSDNRLCRSGQRPGCRDQPRIAGPARSPLQPLRERALPRRSRQTKASPDAIDFHKGDATVFERQAQLGLGCAMDLVMLSFVVSNGAA